MITCTLKDKKYAVDFISGRALREMEPAAKMYAKIVALSNAAVKRRNSAGAADQRYRRDGRDDPLVLPAVRESVHFGRCAGRLSRGSPDARYCAGAHGRADTDHRNSQSVPYEGGEGTGDDADGSGVGRDSAVLTLPEFIYSTYNSLLESGWRMDEIDRMDMPGFLKIRAWNAKREQEKKASRQRYIDEVWTNLSPVNFQ